MKRNTAIYIFAFFLFFAGVGWLCYASFSESSVYFLNVSEAKNVGLDKLNQARLFGLVADGSIKKNSNMLIFNLEDKDMADNIIPVIYTGTIPDTFKNGAEVIVEGTMSKDGQFLAKILMTKCPSKYQKENRTNI